MKTVMPFKKSCAVVPVPGLVPGLELLTVPVESSDMGYH